MNWQVSLGITLAQAACVVAAGFAARRAYHAYMSERRSAAKPNHPSSKSTKEFEK